IQLNAQITSGGSLDAERKHLNAIESSFVIESQATQGVIIIECAVNRDGIVTSTKCINEQSTVKSTPSIIKAENLAKKLKFTPGTKYAPFEHVRVKYTYKKVIG
ncbi:MAG TPA: hypothetical protein PLI97_12760, partial [Fluviicola sp.]|nr:hypothetical protein [Fluviicola sp.]